jgi:molybdate-binding protein
MINIKYKTLNETRYNFIILEEFLEIWNVKIIITTLYKN